MDKKKLLEILKDDDLHILDVKIKISTSTPDDRLKSSFNEITKFYKINNREPEPNIQDVIEYKLFERLKNIRSNLKKIEMLLPFDKYGLLDKVSIREPKSLTEIFQDDTLNLLEEEDDEREIFNLKNVPQSSVMPGEIATRKPCKEFDKFDKLFASCKEEIKSNLKQIVPFTNEQQMKKGHFFILNGIMVYVAQVGEKHSKRGKTNARLRCVFENGTESNMLLRSLATALYLDKNGRRILSQNEIAPTAKNILANKLETGYVYILKSLSNVPEIKLKADLYKVGYTSGSIDNRIKNATKDPTYLMAPVELVTQIKCYNLNPQKFERLLHHFFSEACLDIQVSDLKGIKHSPSEWFIVPIEEILLTVKLIMNGEIVHYYYDQSIQKVVPKSG